MSRSSKVPQCISQRSQYGVQELSQHGERIDVESFSFEVRVLLMEVSDEFNRTKSDHAFILCLRHLIAECAEDCCNHVLSVFVFVAVLSFVPEGT